MAIEVPSIVIIAGPNGAGKTTISRDVLASTIGVTEFVNADVIAQGLSGFEPERAAFQAGRVMLSRMRELVEARSNFAFETTLASRTFAPWLRDVALTGYAIHLIFVWVRSPEISIQRVKARVRRGGHFVPDDVVRRRYYRGIHNFMNLYQPIASAWRVYDNSLIGSPRLVASAVAGEFEDVIDPVTFQRIKDIANAPPGQAQDRD